LDGEKHGYGKFTNTDGTSYEGQWAKGKMHGEGIKNFKDNQCRKGLFNNGKLEKWLGSPVS
jgi:hypothetical protein